MTGAGLEANPHAHLRCKGNADGRAWAEKVSECAAGNAQLIGAVDGLGRRAVGTGADVSGVSGLCLRRWNRQSCDVGHVIRARIIPIEDVEELSKRRQGQALRRRRSYGPSR